MSYDAVGQIEYAFGALFANKAGDRRTSHDADVFRNGDPESLKGLVGDLANALEYRMTSFLAFSPEDNESGGTQARITAAINNLRRLPEKITKDEPEDYHWLLIGNLVWVIASLLDHFEKAGK